MKYLYIVLAIIILSSCEDVVDISLTEGPKRLVIDANINWEKGSLGNEQIIRLTETTGYYETTIPAATGASVIIRNSNLTEIEFFEDGTTGLYKTSNFIAQINETYTLEILYKGEKYTAFETLKPIAKIDSVAQSIQNIFGKDVVRVDFNYTDPIDEENYYLAEFSSNVYLLNVYRTWDDALINGNSNSVFEIDEDLKENDSLKLRFYGISKAYHNYITLLLQQIESNGPFAIPPSELKGNCINTDNSENKPLGYFRLSEYVITDYNIE